MIVEMVITSISQFFDTWTWLISVLFWLRYPKFGRRSELLDNVIFDMLLSFLSYIAQNEREKTIKQKVLLSER